MGEFNRTCALTNLPIYYNEDTMCFILQTIVPKEYMKPSTSETYNLWAPIGVILHGKMNEYGGLGECEYDEEYKLTSEFKRHIEITNFFLKFLIELKDKKTNEYHTIKENDPNSFFHQLDRNYEFKDNIHFSCFGLIGLAFVKKEVFDKMFELFMSTFESRHVKRHIKNLEDFIVLNKKPVYTHSDSGYVVDFVKRNWHDWREVNQKIFNVKDIKDSVILHGLMNKIRRNYYTVGIGGQDYELTLYRKLIESSLENIDKYDKEYYEED